MSLSEAKLLGLWALGNQDKRPIACGLKYWPYTGPSSWGESNIAMSEERQRSKKLFPTVRNKVQVLRGIQVTSLASDEAISPYWQWMFIVYATSMVRGVRRADWLDVPPGWFLIGLSRILLIRDLCSLRMVSGGFFASGFVEILGRPRSVICQSPFLSDCLFFSWFTLKHLIGIVFGPPSIPQFSRNCMKLPKYICNEIDLWTEIFMNNNVEDPLNR